MARRKKKEAEEAEETAAVGSEEDAEAEELGEDAEQPTDGETEEAEGAEEGETADDGGPKASDITAPSIGPNTVIEHRPPGERLDHDKISDTDAFGLDKRRTVVGKRYSASPARQAVIYGIFVAVVVALVIGGKALADKLDQPPKQVKAQAPWTGTQIPPRDVDFPEYGSPAS